MISMVQDMASQKANQRFAPTGGGKMGMSARVPKGVQTKGIGFNVNLTNPLNPISINDSGKSTVKGPDIIGDTQKAIQNPGESLQQEIDRLGENLYDAAGRLGYKGGEHKETLQPIKQSDEAKGILDEQKKAYETYLKNVPGYRRKLEEGISKEANKSMYQKMRGVEQRNVSRGLGYGALNESMKEEQRGQSQQELANQITNLNRGLLDLGEQMRTGAIQTGVGMQGDVQNRLNQLYQRRMAEYNANTQEAGSFMGLLASLGMMAGS